MPFDFLCFLSQTHPELGEKYKSGQYLLSGKVIEKKLALNATQCQMASFMNVPLETYLAMESGSMEIEVQAYERALAAVDSK